MTIISILLTLLSNAVSAPLLFSRESIRDISVIFNRIAIITLIYSVLQEIVGLFIKNDDIGLFGGLLYTTNITQTFHMFILIISILILQLTSFSSQSSHIHINLNPLLYIKEYPVIILFIITGGIFLISANDFVSIYLSIELQSYGLYLLSTINKNSEWSTTGGLLYFLLGGLSSCFILLGIALIYANSGNTGLDGLYIITSISDGVNDISGVCYRPYYINFALLIFTIGFLFKVSAAPFHFWSPDVYDAIPTIVTTFVAIVAKISIFILLLQLVYYINNNYLGISWTFGILISSFMSLIIGTVGGLTQFRIKRLFAYSTISHVGFILLSLAIFSVESLQAFLFYLIQYTISNLNAFIILIAIGFSLHFYKSSNKEHEELKDKINSPVQLVNQLKGYFYLNPFMSLSLSITIFSFAGIPPLLGFFGKQMVLSAALDKGYIFLSLVAIITSVIGAVYYLNIIKEMFFFLSNYKLNKLVGKINNILNSNDNYINFYNGINITNSSYISITISTITMIILLFIVDSQTWLSMGTMLGAELYNT